MNPFGLGMRRKSSVFLGLFLAVATYLPAGTLAATLVVNPSSPNASDSGAGSRLQPFVTITAAMKRFQPGDHLVIEAGIYREPIIFPARSWAGSAQTVIEGDPNGKTIIKGSVVSSGWQTIAPGRFVSPVGFEPEQVFLDGQPLQQIGGTVFGGYPGKPNHPLAGLHPSNGGIWPGRINGDRNSMPPNSFNYDRESGNVMIRVDADALTGHTIEISKLQRLAFGEGIERLTLKNLTFEHSNTTATTRGGAVQLDGKNIRLDRISIRRADGTCALLIGSGHEIVDSVFEECGQTGLGGRGADWTISDVTVRRNNTRGFNKWWEAGGAKFVGNGGLNSSTIVRLKAIDNQGDGLWFDWKNKKNRISDSLLAFNTGFGLHLEICDGFTVDNNVIAGNRQRGIYLRQTSQSTLAFNLVAGNGMEGIAIIDDGQRDPQSEMDFSVRDNWVVGNVIAWNAAALTMPEPLLNNRSDANLLLGDASANSLSFGWKYSPKRPEWLGKGLDTSSEWRDLPKTDRPGLNVTQALYEQFSWYSAVHEKSAKLPNRLFDDLRTRAPLINDNSDPRPGPVKSTWLHP